jgi:hypothetical protein
MPSMQAVMVPAIWLKVLGEHRDPNASGLG